MLRKLKASVWWFSLPVWLLLITIFVGSSWVWNLHTLDQQALTLALERGRYTFKILEATRHWVARNGVAYVRRSDKTPSNPYLEIAEKDITTPSGIPLTAVNPAYMTRQLSVILARYHDLDVHLTSLKPLNPNNQPDAWESKALASFEQGVEEKIERVNQSNHELVRYMAPLYVKKSCMKCHDKQDYEIGDARGGISVSFAFNPFIQSTAGQRKNINVIHMVAWFMMMLFTFVTIQLMRRNESFLKRARDVAERQVKQRTAELQDEVQFRRNTENQLQLIIDSTGEGIFGINNLGRVSFMNPSGLAILGYSSSAEVVGRDVESVFHCTRNQDDADKEGECLIQYAWQQGRSGHSEDETFQRSDGESLAIEYHVHPLRDQETVIGAVVNFSDISDRKARQENMWRQANYDSLTGIPNRSLLLDRLQNAMEQSRRGDFKLAVLYIDLNAFKPINDRYGHEVGDQVLQVISNRLQAHVRENDTVARIGGDEFIVLLNQVENRDKAERIGNILKRQVIKPIYLGQLVVAVGMSIGISIFPDDADDLETLISSADESMYRDKGKGQPQSSVL